MNIYISLYLIDNDTLKLNYGVHNKCTCAQIQTLIQLSNQSLTKHLKDFKYVLFKCCS